MRDEFFVDTNVLVYAFDASEKEKNRIAKKIIEEITLGEKKGVVSNQILAELFVVLTRKVDSPIEAEKAQAIVNGFIDSMHWRKVNYTALTVSRAIESSAREKRHFWDALITETMIENRVFSIITENTKDFRNSPHIVAKNPFK